MLFLVMVFLVFALFIIVRAFHGYQAIWLGLILLAFGGCLIGLMGLVPRFGYYKLDGIINLVLDQPNWVIQSLGRLSLYDFMRFRLWSGVAFISAMIGFANSYANTKNYWRVTKFFLILGIVFLAYYYDPEHFFYLYKKGAASSDYYAAWSTWQRNLCYIDWFSFFLVIVILSSAVAVVFNVFRNSKIQQKKVQALCVTIGIAILGVFFVLLFTMGSASILNAHTAATTLLPLGPEYPFFDATYLKAVPFATILSIGAVLISMLRYGFLGSWHLGTRYLEQQIQLANQAVRLSLHSFKNQFLGVQMALDMALKQMDGLSGEQLERARTQIQWAKDISNDALRRLDVLHYQAKPLRLNPQLLSLQKVCETALGRSKNPLKKVQLEKRYLAEEVNIWGDREQLESLMQNLIENAFEAMSHNYHEKYFSILTIEIGTEYEWAYVKISDNGPGISPKILHKIFRPFFTTKPSKNNWGLGLTYCHRVAKIHRGYINIFSKESCGTTVEVILRRRENLDNKLINIINWSNNVQETST